MRIFPSRPVVAITEEEIEGSIPDRVGSKNTAALSEAV